MVRKNAIFKNHEVRAKGLSLARWVLLLFLFVLFLSPADGAEPRQKQILVLHSYHQGLVWTDDIMEGIYSVFDKDDPDVDIHIEYMDTKRHFDGFDGKYLNGLRKIYGDKYGAMRFDVIISSDDNALRFLLMRHDELFPDTPIVFCGVNNYRDEMLTGHENTTGVLEFLDQRDSLDLALKLHPDAEQVFIITDTSTTGNANRLLMEELAFKYKDRAEFVFMDRDNSGLTRQELLDKLEGLPEKSIVYYSDFLRSREGYIDQETVVPMVSRASRRPVYTHYDEILGMGVVGGKLVNGHSHGRNAAEIAIKVMRGTPVSEIPVYRESINRYMFDYIQLKRFGIAGSDLPENSIVINKAASFYESHKKTVWTAAGIVGTLSVLVVFLTINIMRRKSAEEKLKEAHDGLELKIEERTRELSRSNRLLQEEMSEREKMEEKIKESEKRFRAAFENVAVGASMADLKGRFIKVNRFLCEMTGYSEDELLSKTFSDVTHPDDVQIGLDALKKMLSGEADYMSFEKRYVRKDGQLIHVTI
jgi:PAS domain S-box-containing protein